MNKVQHVKVHETKLTSEFSFPTDSLLAQLAEHGTDDLEVVGSILGRDNFFILLFFCNAGRILPRIGRKFRIMQKLDCLTSFAPLISNCSWCLCSSNWDNYIKHSLFTYNNIKMKRILLWWLVPHTRMPPPHGSRASTTCEFPIHLWAPTTCECPIHRWSPTTC